MGLPHEGGERREALPPPKCCMAEMKLRSNLTADATSDPQNMNIAGPAQSLSDSMTAAWVSMVID